MGSINRSITAAVAIESARPVTFKDEAYAAAERRMNRGRKLVIAGFAVALIGIVGYCIAGLGAGFNQDFGALFLENLESVVGLTLGVIGIGTLLWLLGSFMYLSGAMDSDPDKPQIQ